jgi:hypothetical protein
MITPKYDYHSLNRSNSVLGRQYDLPDGIKVPSVTNILNKTKTAEQKQALFEWKKKMGPVASNDITITASSRGTRMHTFLEGYIRNGVLSDHGTNPYSKQAHGMANAIIDQGLINVTEYWGIEVPMYYPDLYAGTTDVVGLWNNQPAIIDFKQSNKLKKREWIDDYFMQTTAYALAHNAVYDTNIRTGVILICTQNYEFQQFIIEDEEFDYWANKWSNKVSQYYGV